jgi:hypothetical protein
MKATNLRGLCQKNRDCEDSASHFLRRWEALMRQIDKGFVFKILRLFAAGPEAGTAL